MTSSRNEATCSLCASSTVTYARGSRAICLTCASTSLDVATALASVDRDAIQDAPVPIAAACPPRTPTAGGAASPRPRSCDFCHRPLGAFGTWIASNGVQICVTCLADAIARLRDER